MRMPVRLPAYTAYLLTVSIGSFARGMIFLGLSAYYVRTVGMNPLQLVLVGTAIELTSFLFEVPTGIVADTVSRRLSVIIGGVLVGACYMLTGLLPVFIAIVIAEVIRGIGETFMSGAYDAWITDEVGAEHVGPVFVRAAQFGQAFSLSGGLVSVLLATWFGYQVPIFAGGALMLAIFAAMAWLMPETGFNPTPREDRDTFGQMVHTFSQGARAVRGSPVLILLIVVEVIFGASSEGFDRLWEAHLLTSFTLPLLTLPVIGALDPIAWFALLDILLTLISMTLLEVIRRRLTMTNQALVSRALVGLNGVIVVATLAFAALGRFELALTAIVTRSVAFMLARPIQGTWLNQHIPSQVRATVLSMNSQMNALGQIAGGPGVGWFGNRYGVRGAIGLAGLLLMPALALYARFIRRADVAAAEVEAEVTA
jgi:MFS transporter, DHA3 family, tetracycline resistance protein